MTSTILALLFCRLLFCHLPGLKTNWLKDCTNSGSVQDSIRRIVPAWRGRTNCLVYWFSVSANLGQVDSHIYMPPKRARTKVHERKSKCRVNFRIRNKATTYVPTLCLTPTTRCVKLRMWGATTRHIIVFYCAVSCELQNLGNHPKYYIRKLIIPKVSGDWVKYVVKNKYDDFVCDLYPLTRDSAEVLQTKKINV